LYAFSRVLDGQVAPNGILGI
jgi:CDP-diacylglycerol pyrophosphatase